jgi:hypothetical protein
MGFASVAEFSLFTRTTYTLTFRHSRYHLLQHRKQLNGPLSSHIHTNLVSLRDTVLLPAQQRQLNLKGTTSGNKLTPESERPSKIDHAPPPATPNSQHAPESSPQPP